MIKHEENLNYVHFKISTVALCDSYKVKVKIVSIMKTKKFVVYYEYLTKKSIFKGFFCLKEKRNQKKQHQKDSFKSLRKIFYWQL